MNGAPPIAWTVAGSDSGGGAGLQADLRAFDAFDVHGCSAVAAVTAQNSVCVQRIDAVSPELLDAQLAALAADMPPAAIKTGLLGSAANLRVLATWIDRLRQRNPALAVVVDPVLRSSTGTSFADEELLQAYRHELLPRATLATPNRAEAAALLGVNALRRPREHRAGREGLARHGLRRGCDHRRRRKRRSQRRLRRHTARKRLAEPAARGDTAQPWHRLRVRFQRRRGAWPGALSRSKP